MWEFRINYFLKVLKSFRYLRLNFLVKWVVARIKFKSDKYKKVRGGYSRLLDISCVRCGQHLCLYQKDGPGLLKRMYLDRIYESEKYSGLEKQPLKLIPNFNLTCLSARFLTSSCHNLFI